MGRTRKQLRCKTQVRHVTWESGLVAKRQPEVAWIGDRELRGTDHKQLSCRGNRNAFVHRRLQVIARPEEHGNKICVWPRRVSRVSRDVSTACDTALGSYHFHRNNPDHATYQNRKPTVADRTLPETVDVTARRQTASGWRERLVAVGKTPCAKPGSIVSPGKVAAGTGSCAAVNWSTSGVADTTTVLGSN